MTSSDNLEAEIYLDTHQIALLVGCGLSGLNFLINVYYGTVHSGKMTWYFWLIPIAGALIIYYLLTEWKRQRFRDRVGPLR